MFFVRRLAKTFLLALIIIKSANAQLTEVKTDSGAYLGYSSEHVEGVIAYKGIGYAAPPVGDLRWKPPAPDSPPFLFPEFVKLTLQVLPAGRLKTQTPLYMLAATSAARKIAFT